MEDSTISLQLIVIAAVGGFLVVVAELLEVRNTPKDRRPDFKDPWYWVPYVFNPATGAFLVYVYQLNSATLTPWLALNIGASAPLIIRALIQGNPLVGPVNPGPGA